jgi:hypothetical protein
VIGHHLGQVALAARGPLENAPVLGQALVPLALIVCRIGLGRAPARAMILSSMSVKVRTYLTSTPR